MLPKESKATSNDKDEFIKGQTRAVKASWYFTGLCILSGGRDWRIKAGRTHSISSCVPQKIPGRINWLQSKAGLGAHMAQWPVEEPALSLILFGVNINDGEDKWQSNCICR